MNRTFLKLTPAKLILVLCLAVCVPYAHAALKVWISGETIQAADLNSNFTQVNAAATASITNSKVSVSANIASSKLAGYRYIPRTWVVLLDANKGCGSGITSCTETSPGSITSIVGTAAGSYTVTLGYTATNSTYGILLSSMYTGGLNHLCTAVSLTTTTFTVTCRDAADALADTGFTAVVYDDN